MPCACEEQSSSRRGFICSRRPLRTRASGLHRHSAGRLRLRGAAIVESPQGLLTGRSRARVTQAPYNDTGKKTRSSCAERARARVRPARSGRCCACAASSRRGFTVRGGRSVPGQSGLHRHRNKARPPSRRHRVRADVFFAESLFPGRDGHVSSDAQRRFRPRACSLPGPPLPCRIQKFFCKNGIRRAGPARHSRNTASQRKEGLGLS